MKRVMKPLFWILISVFLIIGMMAALVALMEHKSSKRPDVIFQTLSDDSVKLDQIADDKPYVGQSVGDLVSSLYSRDADVAAGSAS